MTIIGIILMLVAISYWETKNTLSFILGIIALIVLSNTILTVMNLLSKLLDSIITYGLILGGIFLVIFVIIKIFSKNN